MLRRDFIHLACANIACLGLGTFGSVARKLGFARRCVTVHACIGEIFPPLELVRRMRDAHHPDLQFLAGDSRTAEVIYAGIRIPGGYLPQEGNLPQDVQEAALRRLGPELEKQFECKIAQATLDPALGFYYPYLGNMKRSLVFCQFVVRDYVVSQLA